MHTLLLHVFVCKIRLAGTGAGGEAHHQQSWALQL